MNPLYLLLDWAARLFPETRSHIFPETRSHNGGGNRKSVRLKLEPLESRIVPSGSYTTLNSSNLSATYGQNVTLTAGVMGMSGTPAGIVDFYDGSTVIGSTSLVNGSSSLTTSALALGNLVSDALRHRGGTTSVAELALRERSAGRLLSTSILARWTAGSP